MIRSKQVNNELQSIRGWARQSGEGSTKALTSWNWVTPWLAKTASRVDRVVLPVFLLLIGAAIYLKRIKYHKETIFQDMLFFTPPIVALVVWFLMAPDPRFAGAAFWLLGAGAIAVGIYYLNDKTSLENATVIFLFLLVFVFGVRLGQAGGISLPHLSLNPYPHPSSDYRFYPIPEAQIHDFHTASGLTLFVPDEGDMCWDAPLPCTPAPNPNLRLMEDGVLSSGFLIESP